MNYVSIGNNIALSYGIKCEYHKLLVWMNLTDEQKTKDIIESMYPGKLEKLINIINESNKKEKSNCRLCVRLLNKLTPSSLCAECKDFFICPDHVQAHTPECGNPPLMSISIAFPRYMLTVKTEVIEIKEEKYTRCEVMPSTNSYFMFRNEKILSLFDAYREYRKTNPDSTLGRMITSYLFKDDQTLALIETIFNKNCISDTTTGRDFAHLFIRNIDKIKRETVSLKYDGEYNDDCIWSWITYCIFETTSLDDFTTASSLVASHSPHVHFVNHQAESAM